MGRDIRDLLQSWPRAPPPVHKAPPRPRPLRPQVSQQLLQAPTLSSKAPSTTVCLEAGTTDTRHTRSRSPAGTHGAPFPTPEPVPGTSGYPPTVPEAPSLYAPFVLSRSWLPTSSPRSVEAVERGCCRRRARTRELSPPGDMGIPVLGPTEGADKDTAHMMSPCPEGDKDTETCTHVWVHTARRCTQTLFIRVHTQSLAGIRDRAMGLKEERSPGSGAGDGWDTISHSTGSLTLGK